MKNIYACIFASALSVCTAFSASANSNVEMKMPENITAGENFSVELVFSGDGENVNSVACNLTYDPEQIEFISSDYASGGGGKLSINGFSENLESTMTITLEFTALQEGQANIAISECSIYDDEMFLVGSPQLNRSFSISPKQEDSQEEQSKAEEVSVDTQSSASSSKADENSVENNQTSQDSKKSESKQETKPKETAVKANASVAESKQNNSSFLEEEQNESSENSSELDEQENSEPSQDSYNSQNEQTSNSSELKFKGQENSSDTVKSLIIVGLVAMLVAVCITTYNKKNNKKKR